MFFHSDQHNESAHGNENQSGVPLVIVISAWFAVSVFLFAQLAMYSQRQGGLGTPPIARVAGIQLDTDRHTLVIAIHPKCPCTQSTLYELERLIGKTNNKISLTFYIYESSQSPETWFDDSAKQIDKRFPGSLMVRDVDGETADKMGAMVSGSTILYTPDGTPVFWGGITSGRGHSGDNLGSDSIRAIVDGRDPPRHQTLVYGCEITQNGLNELLETCQSYTSGICPDQSKETTP